MDGRRAAEKHLRAADTVGDLDRALDLALRRKQHLPIVIRWAVKELDGGDPPASAGAFAVRQAALRWGHMTTSSLSRVPSLMSSLAGGARRWADTRRMPYVTTIRDFSPEGIRFEISNLVERRRIVDHGGETEYLSAMLAALRPDDLLYDVGTCVGLVALHAATVCTVVGFEPDPSFYGRTARQLELNPTLAVEMHQCAISNENATLTLYTDGAAGNSPSLRHQRGEAGEVAVQARSLDGLIFNSGMAPPTALKLDIEGAELLALQGASRLLASAFRPRLLFLEVHDAFLPAFGGTPEGVMGIVERAGYRVTYQAARADQTHYILMRGDTGQTGEG